MLELTPCDAYNLQQLKRKNKHNLMKNKKNNKRTKSNQKQPKKGLPVAKPETLPVKRKQTNQQTRLRSAIPKAIGLKHFSGKP